MARGREVLDLREALERFLDRHPANQRGQLDDSTRAMLGHADTLLKAVSVGSNAEGEESPGERAARRASSDGVWESNATQLAKDSMTPGQEVAARAAAQRAGGESQSAINARQRDRSRYGSAQRFAYAGEQRDARRGAVMVNLFDAGLT